MHPQFYTFIRTVSLEKNKVNQKANAPLVFYQYIILFFSFFFSTSTFFSFMVKDHSCPKAMILMVILVYAARKYKINHQANLAPLQLASFLYVVLL